MSMSSDKTATNLSHTIKNESQFDWKIIQERTTKRQYIVAMAEADCF